MLGFGCFQRCFWDSGFGFGGLGFRALGLRLEEGLGIGLRVSVSGFAYGTASQTPSRTQHLEPLQLAQGGSILTYGPKAQSAGP